MADQEVFNSPPASRKHANIKVAVRCRPALENELKGNNTFDKLMVDEGKKAVR